MMAIPKKRQWLCIVLTCLMLFGISSTALASGGLEWTTTDVYFRGNNLVVKGYFENNTGRTIDRIEWFRVHVQLKNHHRGWFEHERANFEDINVLLRPGQTLSHKFIIRNVEKTRFDKWKVKWRVNYHYKGYHRHDRHEYFRD